MAAPQRESGRRALGLLALATWLASPWMWWQAQRPVPRAVLFQQLGAQRKTPYFSADGRLFVCGDEEGFRVCDLIERRLLDSWSIPVFNYVHKCAGENVVRIPGNSEVQLVDLITGKTRAACPQKARSAR